MKKSNIAIIIGGVAVCFGAIICVVGFLVGGGLYTMNFNEHGLQIEKRLSYDMHSGNWDVLNNGEYVNYDFNDDNSNSNSNSNNNSNSNAASQNQADNSDTNSEGAFSKMSNDFTSVNVSVTAAEIELIASNENRVEYYFSEWEKVKEFEVKNGTLILKTNPKIGFNLIGSHKKSYVRIYCKNPSAMKNITLQTVSGKVTMHGFSADKISLSSVSGEIDAVGITSNDTTMLITTSGEIDVERVTAKRLEASSVSGNIDISEINSTQGSYSTVSGPVDLDGMLIGNHEVSSTSGSVSIESDLPASEFTCSVSSISGRSTLNDMSFKNSIGNGPNKLSVNTTSGSIEFELGD